MRIVLVTLFTFVIVSCTNKKENCALPKEEKKFEMYQIFVMSMLMDKMYAYNERLKQRIIAGDTIGKFPQHFLKIHQAVMTDKQAHDDFFKSHAKAYIASQELIYDDPKNAKEHFNASIDACVTCHEVKCGGPIVRIKKLYIK